MILKSGKLSIVILLVLSGFQSFAQNPEALLPLGGELPGWNMDAEPLNYTGDDLFLLINGGADIYHEYGFQSVVSVKYTDPNQNRIQVEIYEMTDASAAYGIFSLMQQSGTWTTAYGNISVVTGDYIAFWKSKYYAIFSWSSRQHTDKPMLGEIAGLVDEKIVETGVIPDLVREFKLDDPGIKKIFLKGNLALSNFYYFDYKDVFHIDEGLAYTAGQYHLILFRYPDAESASQFLTVARQSIANNKRFTEVASAFQGFTCSDNKGNFIQIRWEADFIFVIVSLDKSLVLAPILDDIVAKVAALSAE